MRFAYLTKINRAHGINAEKEITFLNGKKYIRVIAFILLAIWCFGFSSASLFPKSIAIILYPLLKQFYSNVCHQIGYKCIEMNGINFLVCARCSGIYFGGLLSSTVFLLTTKSYQLDVNFIFLAALPMAIDVILYSLGVYHYSKITALTTGFFFGFITVSFILSSIEKFLFNKEITGTNELT